MSFGKWRPFCLGLNVLTGTSPINSMLYMVSHVCHDSVSALRQVHLHWGQNHHANHHFHNPLFQCQLSFIPEGIIISYLPWATTAGDADHCIATLKPPTMTTDCLMFFFYQITLKIIILYNIYCLMLMRLGNDVILSNRIRFVLHWVNY